MTTSSTFHPVTRASCHVRPSAPARLSWIAACLAISSASVLSGCAATQVAIAKRDLDVQTRMSATVFLDPVAAQDRTIFLQVRNTSDQQTVDTAAEVAAALARKGYRVVDDPTAARYYLQANVLYAGKSSRTAAESFLAGGYGGAVGGALIGVTLGAATGGPGGLSGRNTAVAGLLGGFAETVSGALVRDVYITVVTDVQIKERLAQGKVAQSNSSHEVKQGTSGAERQNFSDQVDMRTYQTRVVSTANQVNLEFDQAAEPLRSGLVRALSGLF